VSVVLNGDAGPLNDQQKHFLKIARQAIDRLSLLISDLLDISRIEAGKVRLEMKGFDLKVMLKQIGEYYENVCKRKRTYSRYRMSS